jgi:hypothetical protein
VRSGLDLRQNRQELLKKGVTPGRAGLASTESPASNE